MTHRYTRTPQQWLALAESGARYWRQGEQLTCDSCGWHSTITDSATGLLVQADRHSRECP